MGGSFLIHGAEDFSHTCRTTHPVVERQPHYRLPGNEGKQLGGYVAGRGCASATARVFSGGPQPAAASHWPPEIRKAAGRDSTRKAPKACRDRLCLRRDGSRRADLVPIFKDCQLNQPSGGRFSLLPKRWHAKARRPSWPCRPGVPAATLVMIWSMVVVGLDPK